MTLVRQFRANVIGENQHRKKKQTHNSTPKPKIGWCNPSQTLHQSASTDRNITITFSPSLLLTTSWLFPSVFLLLLFSSSESNGNKRVCAAQWKKKIDASITKPQEEKKSTWSKQIVNQSPQRLIEPLCATLHTVDRYANPNCKSALDQTSGLCSRRHRGPCSRRLERRSHRGNTAGDRPLIQICEALEESESVIILHCTPTRKISENDCDCLSTSLIDSCSANVDNWTKKERTKGKSTTVFCFSSVSKLLRRNGKGTVFQLNSFSSNLFGN